jgi:hypothetical protein
MAQRLMDEFEIREGGSNKVPDFREPAQGWGAVAGGAVVCAFGPAAPAFLTFRD